MKRILLHRTIGSHYGSAYIAFVTYCCLKDNHLGRFVLHFLTCLSSVPVVKHRYLCEALSTVVLSYSSIGTIRFSDWSKFMAAVLV